MTSNARRPMVRRGTNSVFAKRVPNSRPIRPMAGLAARPGAAKIPGGKVMPLRPMKMPGATLSPRMISGRKPAKKMTVQKMGRKR